MTQTQAIVVQAAVSDGEVPALNLAAQQLSQVLSKAAGRPVVISFAFAASVETIDRSGASSLVITSLLDEADNFDEPWAEVEARLRQRYVSLTEDDRLVVYVCTVFRHISSDGDRMRSGAQRTRIRRLNLLAAELSRETGLFVIDIDRALADVGARALVTDYRLAGPYAAGFVSNAIAETLLTTGFDDFASFEVQEEARALLASQKPPKAMLTNARPMALVSNTLAVRSGRRVQNVETVGRKQDQVGLYIRQLLTGRMSPLDALQMVSRAVGKRGLWHFVSVVGKGAGRALRGRARSAEQETP